MKPPPQPRSAGRRKSGDESARATARRGKVARRTKETSVEVDLRLAPGEARIATGLPFFDHMLEQISRHGGMALTVRAKGDLEVDAHHTVEDVGIGIGEALRQAVADKAGLARYGHAVVPLDEALVEAVVDLSGRPLTQDFLQALVNHARVCLHVNVRYGRNLHHVVEAIFKATARALRAATAPQAGAGVPSTKGML